MLELDGSSGSAQASRSRWLVDIFCCHSMNFPKVRFCEREQTEVEVVGSCCCAGCIANAGVFSSSTGVSKMSLGQRVGCSSDLYLLIAILLQGQKLSHSIDILVLLLGILGRVYILGAATLQSCFAVEIFRRKSLDHASWRLNHGFDVFTRRSTKQQSDTDFTCCGWYCLQRSGICGTDGCLPALH